MNKPHENDIPNGGISHSAPDTSNRPTPLSLNDLPHEMLRLLASHLTNSEKAKLALSCKNVRDATQADHIGNAFIQKVLYDDQESIKDYFEKLTSNEEEPQRIFFAELTIIDSKGNQLKGCAYQFAYWMRNEAMCKLLEKDMTDDTKQKMRKLLIDEEPNNTPSIFDVLHTESIDSKINETIVENEADRRKRQDAALRHGILRGLGFGSIMAIIAIPSIALSFLIPGAPIAVTISVTVGLIALILGMFFLTGAIERRDKIVELSPPLIKCAHGHYRNSHPIPTLAKQYQVILQSSVLRIGSRFKPTDITTFLTTAKKYNHSLRIIDLRNKQLESSDMHQIISENQSNVHTLDLSDNPNITSRGIKTFLFYTPYLSSLSHLFLNNIGIDNQSISSMKSILQSLKKLNTLSLKNNKLDSNYISQLIACMKVDGNALLILNLGDNDIKNNGVEAIASWIETNPKLKTLDLSNNPFDDLGAGKLLEALKKNTNLECLHLPSSIDPKIQQQIIQILKTNKESALQTSYLQPK